MYVLRDPRDGTVFLVGRGRDSVEPPSPPVDHLALAPNATRDRIRAIGDDGYQVEHVILVDELTSEAEAATVEQAVLSAYQAARLSPTTLVGVAHNSAGAPSRNSGSPTDAFDDPSVRQFVADAAAEIERLATALTQAESDLAAVTSAQFLDGDHRQRLEELILRQESEISQLNSTLDRVRALADLAHWAGRAVNGADVDATIRLADLGRALE